MLDPRSLRPLLYNQWVFVWFEEMVEQSSLKRGANHRKLKKGQCAYEEDRDAGVPPLYALLAMPVNIHALSGVMNTESSPPPVACGALR